MSGKTWDFTLNNYNVQELQWAKALEQEVSSGRLALERGTEGTPHIQGRVTFARNYRLPALKKLCPRAHWEKTKCPHDTLYCLKAGEEQLWQKSKVERQRTDLTEARAQILGKRRWQDVVNDPELTEVLSRHHQWAKLIFTHKLPSSLAAPEEWRPWQAKLLSEVTTDCTDDRKIIWFYDPACGAGKTTITKYLVRNHDAIVLSGKTADVLNGYDDQGIVIFDIPKDAQSADKDFIPYGAIEKIKDGTFYSGKYEGRMHVRDFEAHVIVFANCLPKVGCWDPSRTDLRLLSDVPSLSVGPSTSTEF